MSKDKNNSLKDFARNWASDDVFATTVRDDLMKIWQFCQSEREEREDQWEKGYRAWSTDKLQEDRNYDGLSDIELPQIRKEVETMSRRIVKGLFPDDFLKAHSNILANEKLAQVNSDVMSHYIENVMKFRTKAIPWIKQGVIYGTSPIRTFWNVKQNEALLKSRKMVISKDGVFEPKTVVKMQNVVRFKGPVARAEDMFQTWVYPVNASSPDDIEITFWRTKVTKSQLEEKQRLNTAFGIESFKDNGKKIDQVFEESQVRFQQFGNSGQLVAVQDDGLFDLLEIWIELKLPNTEVRVPVVVEIIDETHTTRIQRNPFWHQRSPFDFMRYIIPPAGEFYGRGLPEASIEVQRQLNDTINQGMDSATLSLNNITIINPAFAPNSDSFEVEPGAIWWADPAAIKQMTFPDLTQTSLTNMSMLRSIITEMSDNSPQLPDPISGKARSTGQAQIALGEFQTDLLMFLQSISDESLEPMAKKIHSLIQQFLDEDSLIRISPKYASAFINNIVDPSEIAGDFDFTWITGVDIDNGTIKTQQMLNFIRVMTQLQGVMPQGERVNVNWENFAIKLIRDGFKIKDFHNIIESQRINDSIEPAMEYKILAAGGQIDVQKNDKDKLHIQVHNATKSKLKDAFHRAQMNDHILKHQEQLQRKEAIIQAKAQLLAAQQVSEQTPKKQGQPGSPSQIPESTSSADLERGQR